MLKRYGFLAIVLLAFVGAATHLHHSQLPVTKPSQFSHLFPAPANSSILKQQQRLEKWLEEIALSAEGDQEATSLLHFLRLHAVFADSRLAPPPPKPDTFYLSILTEENETSSNFWHEELHRMQDQNLYSHFDHRRTTLLIRERPVLKLIKGILPLPHLYRAHRELTLLKGRNLSPLEEAEEDLKAYTLQLRLFRKNSGPSYQSFRPKLVKMFQENIRQQNLETEDDSDITSGFPNPRLMSVLPDKTWANVFGHKDPLSAADLQSLRDLVYLDLSLQAIADEKADLPPQEIRLMQTSFLIFLKAQGSGDH